MKQFFLVLILLPFHLLSQTDFNLYEPLKCSGDIPLDFKESLVFDSITKTSTKDDLFILQTHHSINQLLHSGRVIYNDPISSYVKNVARILLKDDMVLFNQLRFYTIKSRTTNAFATDQGMIFVTTGLISQVQDESQLAAIIAHEIIHFKNKHVHEQYEKSIELQKSKSFKREDHYIIQLSNYSKELEFDADREGIKMALKAGYSKESILTMFDVLLYSHLAFDEITFDTTFYNSDYMILTGLFTNKPNDINHKENTDDHLKSHPNIKKRKIKFGEMKAFDEFNNGKSHILEKSKFITIRDIARFESLRTSILQQDYIRALYEHFLLHEKYPNSNYLGASIVKIWYGIISYFNKNQKNNFIKNFSSYEGEEHKIAYFIKKLQPKQQVAVALRIIQDQAEKFPENKIIKLYRNQLIADLLENKSNFSFIEFFEYSKPQYDSIANSIIKVENDSIKSKSKYDKILDKKQKKEFDHKHEPDYLYWLTDYKSNEELLSQLNGRNQEEKLEIKSYDETVASMQTSDFRKKRRRGWKLNFDSVIILKPHILYNYEKIMTASDFKKISRDPIILNEKYTELTQNFSIDGKSYVFLGDYQNKTALFNRFSRINEWALEFLSNEHDIQFSSVLYDDEELIQAFSKTNYIVIPSIVITRRKTYIYSLVYHSNTGKLVYILDNRYFGKSSIYKSFMYLYDHMNQISKS
jgi:hypothetical protein